MFGRRQKQVEGVSGRSQHLVGGLSGRFFTLERRLKQSREDQWCGMQNKKMNPAGGVEEADVGVRETVYF